MNLIEKFAERIDSDQGYDNLSLAQDLAKISDEHHSEQCMIDGVRVSDEEDDFDDSDESIDWCSYCGDEPKLNGKDYCKGCKTGVDWMK
jgi:hypothetical protein